MLVFAPFPSNHLNDFSNDLNVFEKPLGCFRQTIRMNPENHLDDFAGRTKKKKKTLQKSFPKVLKNYFNTSQVRQETSFSIDALTKISPFNRHFYSHIHTISATQKLLSGDFANKMTITKSISLSYLQPSRYMGLSKRI